MLVDATLNSEAGDTGLDRSSMSLVWPVNPVPSLRKGMVCGVRRREYGVYASKAGFGICFWSIENLLCLY